MSEDKKKSGLDSFFDMAEGVLGGVEGALGGVHVPGQEYKYEPSKDSDIIDAEFKDVQEKHEESQKTWEHTWRDDVVWGVDKNQGWHAIPMGSPKTVCQEVATQDLTDRKKLEPGVFIKGCTSCILGVCRRG